MEKYQPKIPNEIIGNKIAINKIHQWLNEFPKTLYSNMVINGNHGIGKNLSVNLILKELSYESVITHSSEIKNYRSTGELSQVQNYEKNLGSILLEKSNKFCLVIDCIEMITLPSEKKYLIENLKNNHKKKYFPIILINNGQHSKMLNEIKKIMLEINFIVPSYLELKPYIKNIMEKEKINFDNKYIIGLIKFCRNDIRKILVTLEDLKLTFKDKEISKEELSEFYENNSQKKEEIGLYSSVEKVLYQYKNMEEITSLYQLEPILLPLNIHENLGNKMNFLKINENEKIKKMAEIEDRISQGDIIETSIYTDQNWYLKNLHTFYTCIYPSFEINQSPVLEHEIKMNFTNDLNRTSLKKINNKNFEQIKKIFPNFNSNDIYQLSHILYSTIKETQEQENPEKLKILLNSFPVKLTQKEIELIIKINKIDFESKDIYSKFLKSIFN
jgi:replication factor C subunit 1